MPDRPDTQAMIESATKPTFDFTCSMCESRGTYKMMASCSNCGLEGVAVYSRTHEAEVGTCPRCGTRQVRALIPRQVVS